MPRSSKPAAVIEIEGKTHLSKEEIEFRKAQEEAVLSGVPMSEFPVTKEDEEAHKEFLRIKNLLRKINKNDDFFAGSINRYAQIHSEILGYQTKRIELEQDIQEAKELWKIEKEKPDKERAITMYQYLDTLGGIRSQLFAIDKLIQTKRKMMLDIEKENVMTICAGLKAIPKKPPEKKEGEGDEFDSLFDLG